MKAKTGVKGFALICKENGVIEQVLRDDFGLMEPNTQGKLLSGLILKSEQNRVLDFLLEIKQKKISFDYRFDLSIHNKVLSIYFMGIQLPESLLIIGADNHKEAMDFTNHLQQINNEQANTIRELLKREAQLRMETNETSESRISFDNITLLNNELVNLQRELTKKNAELARLNDLKNNFLGMAAHDLRNPLGAIMNFSEFIKDEASDNLTDEQVHFLEIIQSSADFMLNLVENLLDISKIESGKLQLNLVDFDVIELAKKCLFLNQSIAAKKKIKIRFNVDVEHFSIRADNHKIEQVFNNLINNAVKFSNEGSEIVIEFKQIKEKIQFSVKDQGVGIAEEDIGKVFSPYKTLKARGTANEKGTGLGLTIVKRIVEGHSGEIWLESKIGKGTTFFFTISTGLK